MHSICNIYHLNIYITSQNFLNSKMFNVCLTKPAFIWSKVQWKSTILKYFVI